jgi:hypothetical protein
MTSANSAWVTPWSKMPGVSLPDLVAAMAMRSLPEGHSGARGRLPVLPAFIKRQSD